MSLNVPVEPDLEELLRKLAANPHSLGMFKMGKLLHLLDKMVDLQVRKLSTLVQLRDTIKKNNPHAW